MRSQSKRNHRSVARARALGRVAVATAAFALAFASTAGAHSGQGNALPDNEGAHPWDTDACSTPGININSVAGIYNFRHVCIHHDGCYKGFPSSGKPTYWVSRSQCDAWFLYDMQASCRWPARGPGRDVGGRRCMQWATNYHYAVRTHASGAYKGPTND